MLVSLIPMCFASFWSDLEKRRFTRPAQISRPDFAGQGVAATAYALLQSSFTYTIETCCTGYRETPYSRASHSEEW